jgi:hypothetical protein
MSGFAPPSHGTLGAMNRRRLSPPVVAGLVLLHVIVTTLTWHDLSNRTANQVRGPKWFWRVFTGIQMGNSALYWMFGWRAVRPTGS